MLCIVGRQHGTFREKNSYQLPRKLFIGVIVAGFAIFFIFWKSDKIEVMDVMHNIMSIIALSTPEVIVFSVLEKGGNRLSAILPWHRA